MKINTGKMKFALAAAFAVSTLMTACAPKELVVSRNVPVLETREGIVINWDQVKEECSEVLNAEEYPHGVYIDFAVHEEEKVVELIWPLTPEATQLEALDYGRAFIKAFNDAVATQDFSYAWSSEDYYGGFWDKYGVDLQIFKEADILNPELYYVNQVMDPGANDPVLPQIQSGKETAEAEEGVQMQESAGPADESKAAE